MNVVRNRRAKPRMSWKALALRLLAAGTLASSVTSTGLHISKMPTFRNAVHKRQLRSINKQKQALNVRWVGSPFDYQNKHHVLNQKRNKLNRVHKYGQACAEFGSMFDPACMIAMNKYEKRKNARIRVFGKNSPCINDPFGYACAIAQNRTKTRLTRNVV